MAPGRRRASPRRHGEPVDVLGLLRFQRRDLGFRPRPRRHLHVRGGTLRTGIVVSARPGVEELAVRAEELGFSSFWVYDSPMLHGDPYLALGLCARVTSRIKLGIGVTSPALRSIPAAAGAFASLN